MSWLRIYDIFAQGRDETSVEYLDSCKHINIDTLPGKLHPYLAITVMCTPTMTNAKPAVNVISLFFTGTCI